MGFRLWLLLPLLLAAVPAPARSAGPDPHGIWLRDDGNARVRIAACGERLCATNLWIRDPASGEAVGDRLELTLSADGEDTLAGTAYDPQRDLSFNMRMTVGSDRLLTRGCILGNLLCKSVSWTRID